MSCINCTCKNCCLSNDTIKHLTSFGLSLKDAKRIYDTEYIVTVGGEDLHNMWLLWHNVLDLVQDQQTLSLNVKSVKGDLTTINISWYSIEGHSVAFVEGVSQIVDYGAIEQWIDATFPVVKRYTGRPVCNMCNFQHCLQEIVPNWAKDEKKHKKFLEINAILR